MIDKENDQQSLNTQHWNNNYLQLEMIISCISVELLTQEMIRLLYILKLEWLQEVIFQVQLLYISVLWPQQHTV